MDIAGNARKMATSAVGVAVATGGLTNCAGGGVVDPLPPALVCSDVAGGRPLVATATRTGGVVNVVVRPMWSWTVSSVSAGAGATLGVTSTPVARTFDSLSVQLTLTAVPPTVVTFTVQGSFTGFQNESCQFTRTFTVTVSADAVQVAELNLDLLPLPARDRATIVAAAREGRVLELVARTGYEGERTVAWTVTAGSLASTDGPRTRWTLPEEPGIYQAEVVVDFGAAGLAFDALMIEVL